MRFEKWQALGNDYVIVAADDLIFELTPERIRRICAPHFGIGSDGVLLLSPSDDAAMVAELRIFNPDGSEAELSGNGAREAVLYLRDRGWTDRDRVLDPHQGGTDPPDDHRTGLGDGRDGKGVAHLPRLPFRRRRRHRNLDRGGARLRASSTSRSGTRNA